ncbi:MAG: preprotein translocase subunit YajC [Planctomycetes bacterium]|nr:preprotein translocase subunit YajC [Planctomycetota bacterium]
MLMSFILFAQDDAKKGADGGILGLLGSNPIIPIMIVMVLFFVLIVWPAQRRQRQEAEELMASMKKNDEVETASGIIGVVASINDAKDEVTLKIDDNAKIRVRKSTIVRIINKEEPPKDAAAPTGPAAAPTTPAAPNTNVKPAT